MAVALGRRVLGLALGTMSQQAQSVVYLGIDRTCMLSSLISLSAGNNTIKFFNPQRWAPDIDRIVV